MADEPVCTEINVSASVGGKVQIVKYEYTADFHYSMGRRYSVPENWEEAQIKAFQAEATEKLRHEIEEVAQAEMDELQRQRDDL